MSIVEAERTSVQQVTSWAAQIKMPYTLTPGQAAGVFLAELARHRLIGSRHGDTVLVPAQDFDGASGAPADGFVEVAPLGEVRAFTTSPSGESIGLILIDGADTPLAHRLIGFPPGRLSVGARVEAAWATEVTGSVLDLEGFRPAGDGESFAPRPVLRAELAEAPDHIDYTMTLDYEHAYGPYYGTLFDAIETERRIRGVQCTQCHRVLLPPRAYCDVCFAPTGQWVDVASTGTVQASSIVHIEFIGQRMTPPYVYAEIVLDGSSTRLIHQLGGFDANAEDAKKAVAPGARVRAVWSERRTGSLADIEYFELI